MRPIPVFDHLVLATPDLAGTAAWIASATGIEPSAGGQHLGRGSRNRLCALGARTYLEVIGPDPDQGPPPTPRPFGLDALDTPGLIAWAIAVEDIEAAIRTAPSAGFDPGQAETMTRRRPDGVVLRWTLTTSPDPMIPFLIDWGDSPHPAATAVTGLSLDRLALRSPEPGPTIAALRALGVDIDVERGRPALIARLRGPAGSIAFG